MAFELTEDFVKDNELTEAQVTALTTFGSAYSETMTADLKKEYDETYKNTANTNADNIINDAIKSTWKATGFELERNQGEKNADYMVRYNSAMLQDKTTAIDALKLDYETKLENFDGDAGTKKQLTDAITELDALKQKTANYDDLVGYETKFNDLSTEHLTMKDEVCFGKVRPNFPDTVDEYRARAMWGECIDSIKKEYKVELVDGEPIAISKENEHRTFKLKDLVHKDETITKLLEGRQQNGPNAGVINKVKIEGVPFDVDIKASSKDIHALLDDQLVKSGLARTSTEYSKKYGEYYEIIRKQKTAA